MQLKEFFVKGTRKKEKKEAQIDLRALQKMSISNQVTYEPICVLPELCQLQRRHNVIQSLLGHLVT
jgi:hypothetical protein